jgi:site-specific DNA recombinase
MKRTRRANVPAVRKAFIYARVSTAEQATEGVSLAAQEAKCRALAAARGLDVAGVYVDAGLSGRRADNRPQLQAAVEAACGEEGVLIVYSLSRLARSVRDSYEIAERLRDARAGLVSATEDSIDTASTMGKALFGIWSIFAELEAGLTRDRTVAALENRRSRGLKTGGPPPYGFRADESGKLEPDADEQRVLARIRRMRAKGKSYVAIANALNEASIPARSSTRHEGATRWHPTTIVRIVERDGSPFQPEQERASAPAAAATA